MRKRRGGFSVLTQKKRMKTNAWQSGREFQLTDQMHWKDLSRVLLPILAIRNIRVFEKETRDEATQRGMYVPETMWKQMRIILYWIWKWTVSIINACERYSCTDYGICPVRNMPRHHWPPWLTLNQGLVVLYYRSWSPVQQVDEASVYPIPFPVSSPLPILQHVVVNKAWRLIEFWKKEIMVVPSYLSLTVVTTIRDFLQTQLCKWCSLRRQLNLCFCNRGMTVLQR